LEKKDIEGKLIKIAYILEVIVVIFITIAVLAGLINMVKYLPEIFSHGGRAGFEVFTDFLSYAMLLVVGVELIFIIFTHSVTHTLHLVLFSVSRKLLIYTHSALDLLLGALAITIIFVAIKYLTPIEEKDNV